MLPLLVFPVLAYSSGGAVDRTPPQLCDAIGVCKYGCPTGMTKVANPERSAAYTLRTGDREPWRDPRSYVPGELLPLYVRVVKRMIPGKGFCQEPYNDGKYFREVPCITGNESAKYIGLLLYAVKTGDQSETKVGSWDIPLQVQALTTSEPNEPECALPPI